MSMIIQSSVKDKILATPIDTSEVENTLAEMLRELDQQMEKRADDARYTSSNLEKSKKCSWSSEGRELEAIRVLWCADYHIHYNAVDFAGREEISSYKVHSGSDG
uniref:Uncharacterized protein n=1 Tax=Tanacetum cinerariifolium TaxID=118510 RepID=A0A6L2L5H8_TANCI|nr:hypothetical protein [Tanacetum cinerariifolium]